MSNLIILSSAASVTHGGRPACLHSISLRREENESSLMLDDDVSSRHSSERRASGLDRRSFGSGVCTLNAENKDFSDTTSARRHEGGEQDQCEEVQYLSGFSHRHLRPQQVKPCRPDFHYQCKLPSMDLLLFSGPSQRAGGRLSSGHRFFKLLFHDEDVLLKSDLF